MDSAYDLVVVGGGIAGGALAIVMARAGYSVLLLEETDAFQDKVRGEWIAPWGVAEVQHLGLYNLLLSAGGHHLSRHTTYEESRPPEAADAASMPLDVFIPGVAGPLCLGHPLHCQTLFDEAGRTGATALRGVAVERLTFGPSPSVAYTHKGERRTARARLIVGADGRTSMVRDAARIVLHQDPPHHLFAGMLIEGAHGWDEGLQAIGTDDGFAFLAFPQGNGRVRLYGSYPLDRRGRFSGVSGQRDFLDAFVMGCAPANRYLAEGTPAGPVMTYVNASSWTDTPYAEGVVLAGDAAGWTDPIIGLGLSIAYRDVRMVTDILKASDDWSPPVFAPYAEERSERMRRLRFAAALTATLDAEFGPKARARRHSYHQRSAHDPLLAIHGLAIMAGPETVPPEFFSPEHRARVLGEPG